MTGLGQTRRVLTMHRKKCPESLREIKSVAVAKRMLLCLSTKEAMEDDHTSAAETPVHRSPWNKGRLVGARPSHVGSIRTKLQMEGIKRDLRQQAAWL
jgi:hypothetical protein